MIVISGPNGAGKSTLAPNLLQDVFGIVEYVNADTLAQEPSAFAPETAAIEADRVMQNRTNKLAKNGKVSAYCGFMTFRNLGSGIRQGRIRIG